MNIIDIENMSAPEIKQRRDECIAAAQGSNIADLAQRYVQARFDAKARDEKLAEQSRMIEALQQGLNAATERASGIEVEKCRLANVLMKRQSDTEDAEASITSLKAEVVALIRRAEVAEKLAKDRRVALAGIMNVIAPSLAQEG